MHALINEANTNLSFWPAALATMQRLSYTRSLEQDVCSIFLAAHPDNSITVVSTHCTNKLLTSHKNLGSDFAIAPNHAMA